MSHEIQAKSTQEVRDEFIDYFQENGHTIIEGSGIIPVDDPTLLFINSGMAPLKPFFRGDSNPPAPRLANSQICIRTTDIDDVGDAHHGTSFRMLGNWSFGSYGKPQAIDFAAGLLTDRYNIPIDRLFATVFESNEDTPTVPSDTESASHWRKYLPSDSIIPSGPDDNFWGPAGDSGPCGPCTEIFYDRGNEHGLTRDTEARSIEIWNAGVFMEYDKQTNGTLDRLATMCVDAGAGLERISMILQDAPSIHEIDQYLPAYNQIKSQLSSDSDTRIVFDHLKTSQILIESGIIPANKGRGYVLRRLIRRALSTLDVNGVEIAEILNMQDMITEVIDSVPFRKTDTVQAGDVLLTEMNGFARILRVHNNFMTKVIKNRVLTAQQVFDATSSSGIPADLIRDACIRNDITFPESDYIKLVEEHRKVSKA
jgi:alanyl-tRNA synthetase